MVTKERGLFFGTAALFVCALLLGGLGPHAPALNGLTQAMAYIVLVAVVLCDPRVGSMPRCAAQAIVLILALLCIGVLQLIPLPATIWRNLPGRDILWMVRETLGLADHVWPLTLAPDDTRMILLALIPPTAVFIATVRASGAERIVLAKLCIIVAAVSSILGLAQLSFGDGTAFLYPTPPFDRYPGLFANFNHQATFLAGAVALLLALAMPTKARRMIAGIAVFATLALLLLGAMITSSRAGIAIFVFVSVGAAIWLGFASRAANAAASAPDKRGPGRRIAVAAVGTLLLSGLIWLTDESYRGELMTSRFESVHQDARFSFWPTVVSAIHTYFPYGSGLGTFEKVYQVSEPLSGVRLFVVNHAHNDYLEFILETGVAGLMWLAVSLTWYVSRVVAVAKSGITTEAGALARAGALIVAAVLLHSFVDYSLRTQVIGCLFAYSCGLLVPAMARLPSIDRRAAVPNARA